MDDEQRDFGQRVAITSRRHGEQTRQGYVARTLKNQLDEPVYEVILDGTDWMTRMTSMEIVTFLGSIDPRAQAVLAIMAKEREARGATRG